MSADDSGMVNILNHLFDKSILNPFIFIYVIKIGRSVIYIFGPALIPYFQHIEFPTFPILFPRSSKPSSRAA